MSATAVAIPDEIVSTKTHVAKITSKGQITIPAEMRGFLGAKPGDKLAFERHANGDIFVRKVDKFPLDRFRGMGTGIPELDNGSIEDIVQWFREARGHDEVDDRMLGTSRFGKSE